MKKATSLSLAVLSALLIGCGGGGGSNDDTPNTSSGTNTGSPTTQTTDYEDATGFGSFTATSVDDLKGVTIVFKTDPNLDTDGIFTTTHAIACDGTFHTTTIEALPNGTNFTLHDYTGTPEVEVNQEDNFGFISFADLSSNENAMTYITIVTDGSGTFYEGQCYLGSNDSSQCLWGQIAYALTQDTCDGSTQNTATAGSSSSTASTVSTDSPLSSAVNITIYNNSSATEIDKAAPTFEYSDFTRYNSSTPLHCTDYGFSSPTLDDTDNGVHSLAYLENGRQCYEIDNENGPYPGNTNSAFYK